MNALWSPQQHQWLKALGHTVYVQGVASTEAADTSEADAPRSESARITPVPPPRRQPESVDSTPVRTIPTPVRRPASRLPDKLHFALIRASGCNPNAGDTAQVIAQWPPSSELRGNPAAKRALWPRLRALRRQPLP